MSVAPFLRKAFDLVCDPATDETVRWTQNGDAFVVAQPDAFARDVLPRYFKHNNFSSFVRQLNTYVSAAWAAHASPCLPPSSSAGSSSAVTAALRHTGRLSAAEHAFLDAMKACVDCADMTVQGFRKASPDSWVFANDGFMRGRRELLTSIVRRKSATPGRSTPADSEYGSEYGGADDTPLASPRTVPSPRDRSGQQPVSGGSWGGSGSGGGSATAAAATGAGPGSGGSSAFTRLSSGDITMLRSEPAAPQQHQQQQQQPQAPPRQQQASPHQQQRQVNTSNDVVIQLPHSVTSYYQSTKHLGCPAQQTCC